MFEAVIMLIERGRRPEQSLEVVKEVGAGWEQVGGVGCWAVLVEEEVVGQDFF